MNGLFALIGGGETVLRAFCSSALWQIYQTQYLLFRMQKCRFTTPQGAGMQVYNSFLLRVQESQCPPWGMGYSLICLRSPDPTTALVFCLSFLFFVNYTSSKIFPQSFCHVFTLLVLSLSSYFRFKTKSYFTM
jgi:hypothetical protein